jgi:5-oxoprolinase (ATP-hydrolysing) subunit C
MRDHQTTGGYPKIATVISADLARLAQCRPGERVRFRRVELAAADMARTAWLAAWEHLLAGVGPAAMEADLAAGRLLALNLIDGVVDAGQQSPP